ncbi:MAG: hypothetical protein ABI778_09295, partial [Ignavibacteriota bacterium]
MKHLVTPRLLMRPYISGDLSDFHAYCTEVGIAGLSSNELSLTKEQSYHLLEERILEFAEYGYGMFALIERKEKRFIGE